MAGADLTQHPTNLALSCENVSLDKLTAVEKAFFEQALGNSFNAVSHKLSNIKDVSLLGDATKDQATFSGLLHTELDIVPNGDGSSKLDWCHNDCCFCYDDDYAKKTDAKSEDIVSLWEAKFGKELAKGGYSSLASAKCGIKMQVSDFLVLEKAKTNDVHPTNLSLSCDNVSFDKLTTAEKAFFEQSLGNSFNTVSHKLSNIQDVSLSGAVTKDQATFSGLLHTELDIVPNGDGSSNLDWCHNDCCFCYDDDYAAKTNTKSENILDLWESQLEKELQNGGYSSLSSAQCDITMQVADFLSIDRSVENHPADLVLSCEGVDFDGLTAQESAFVGEVLGSSFNTVSHSLSNINSLSLDTHTEAPSVFELFFGKPETSNHAHFTGVFNTELDIAPNADGTPNLDWCHNDCCFCYDDDYTQEKGGKDARLRGKQMSKDIVELWEAQFEKELRRGAYSSLVDAKNCAITMEVANLLKFESATA